MLLEKPCERLYNLLKCIFLTDIPANFTSMQRLLILLAIILMLSSCKQDDSYVQEQPVYRTGDNMLWAKTKANDNGWQNDRGDTGDKIFWVRSKIQLFRSPGGPLGLQIHAFGAFDVYWDGVFLGSNGHLPEPEIPGKGVPGKEVPGTESSIFLIPDSLSQPGNHQLALRSSQSYEQVIQRGVSVRVENYISLLRTPLIIMSLMNVMAGAFLIASLYYFFLYANSQQKEYTILIFAVICLLFLTLLIMEYIKFYIDIPYTHFFTRMEIIGWLTFSISFLVPLYFSIQFNFRYKALLTGIILLLLLFIYIYNHGHYDLSAILYSLVMWVSAMAVVINAIIQKEKGSTIVFVGLVLSAVANNFLYYDFGLFISFTLIVLCMLYLHTLRVKIIEQEHKSSLLLSSRLKLELIKKNIQPHFLRNTLTSLIDWVEESPQQGVEFIQALAAEFDIMNEIADAELIPIHQEITLCKTHLSVMQFRKEISYEWEDAGIDEKECIPPAILHTLVENGITHSIPTADKKIYFRLSFELTSNCKIYMFETIAENRPLSENRKGGNGFQYIKARLTESYGDRWDFNSTAVPQGWLTTIKLYNK